jgi:hypothetical protein
MVVLSYSFCFYTHTHTHIRYTWSLSNEKMLRWRFDNIHAVVFFSFSVVAGEEAFALCLEWQMQGKKIASEADNDLTLV